MNNYLKAILLFILTLSLFWGRAFAEELQQKAKLWTAITLEGPLSQNKKIRYYVEPQLRFISRSESFDQANLHVGLGYQYTPSFTLWIGNTLGTTNEPEKENQNQYRIWQQLTWDSFDKYAVNVSTRTRLEERKINENPDWALRLRQKVSFSIPLKMSKGYALVLFDELFFNLNHPSWVNDNLINQNRAFIGFSIPVSKQARLEMGYLNQYEVGTPDKMGHVANFGLKIKTL